MPRYKLTLEYDGAAYVGWQRQANGRSVQEAVEDALLRFSGSAQSIAAAGRTDAGVHAYGQVAHIELARAYEPYTILRALNYYLFGDLVKVVAVDAVADDFHARFSCTGRAYRYRMLNRAAPPTLERGRVWHVPGKMNRTAMREAAALLVGKHDFSAFRSTHCQAQSPIRTVDKVDLLEVGDEIWLEVAARSFLHNQVRIIVGSLRWVGNGHWQVDDIARVLAARERRQAGETAPAHGLYFMEARYDTPGETDLIQAAGQP